MSKPFKTYDEQIEILSSRGLNIDNPDNAKIILSQLNYYNLINGYKTPFLDLKVSTEDEDKYKDGSSFQEIFYLHEMDRELKEVVFFFITSFWKAFKNFMCVSFFGYT